MSATAQQQTSQPEAPRVSIGTDQEIDELIAQITVVSARIKGMERAKDTLKARLQVLQKAKGIPKRTTESGVASFYTHTSYEVHNREGLPAVFPQRVLLEAFKPTKAFVEAAKEARLPVADVITETPDERFKVEGRRTRDAKERRERIIEETQREMEARVKTLATLMRAERQKQQASERQAGGNG